MLTLLLTSLALAMDSVAVSIAIGLQTERLRVSQALKVALVFGFFQALMPLIGYGLGSLFRHQIEAYDHWIAFGILLVLGLKMIHESFDDEEVRLARRADVFRLQKLAILGLATSLDALAVGITFSLLSIQLIPAVLTIGAVCFALCLIAVQGGKRLGILFSNRAELFGGIVLIAIGLRILYQHLAGT